MPSNSKRKCLPPSKNNNNTLSNNLSKNTAVIALNHKKKKNKYKSPKPLNDLRKFLLLLTLILTPKENLN